MRNVVVGWWRAAGWPGKDESSHSDSDNCLWGRSRFAAAAATQNKEKLRKRPLSSNPKIETIQMCCFLFILLLLQYSIFYTGKSERDWKRSISAHPLPKNIHSICQVLGCTSQSQNSLTTSIDRVRLKEQKSPEFLGSDSSVLVFDGSRWRSGWSGRVQGQDG